MPRLKMRNAENSRKCKAAAQGRTKRYKVSGAGLTVQDRRYKIRLLSLFNSTFRIPKSAFSKDYSSICNTSVPGGGSKLNSESSKFTLNR